MAVTITFLHAHQYRLFYSISHDGNAGDSATRTNAQLVADAGINRNLRNLLDTPVANDAAAVTLMAAGGDGNIGAVTKITPGVAAAGWAVDYEEDGANLSRLVVEGEAGTVNDGILEIQMLHSYNR